MTDAKLTVIPDEVALAGIDRLKLPKGVRLFRCCYTEDGIRALTPSNPARLGFAYMGVRNTFRVMVKWDGNKGFETYAKRYVQEVS